LNKGKIKVLFFLVLFLWVNLIYLKGNNEIKYFVGTTGIYGGIEANIPVFSSELDKNLYPLQDTSFFSYINGSSRIIYPDSISKKGGELEIPLKSFYKVYYENNIQQKAELIKVSGYTYVNGVLHIDKNTTKINQGVAFKFDSKGRGIYRYSFETGEVCRTFYAIQYEEVTCTLNKKISKVKTYYENNKYRVSIYYKNNSLIKYSTLFASFDEKGKVLHPNLDHLETLYKNNLYNFSDAKKKLFQNMIEKEKKKLSNIPNLNLILDQHYIEKIDRLNARGGVK
jgi:hypothetical protein